MFICPAGGERVILVHVDFNTSLQSNCLAEFVMLANSSHILPISVITAVRKAPHAKYFIGEGKLQEIQAAIKAYDVSCVIFNHSLSPSQQRNLEKLLCIRVLHRTELILDIFAQRARTYEGKLQVELAQLQHLSTRLVRGWTHLERQKGGIGLRGPGETQLETDRRLLRRRIKTLKTRLEKVRRQRLQGRQRRKRKPVPVIALVGYTNAGKSTLFNRLTGAKVYAADQLFATLDPTLRRLSIPDLGEVVLADTVGFIQHLPHDLVDAFRATLEEVAEADLLLHVIDASDEDVDETVAAVDTVLTEIGAAKIPQIKVFNKIDLVQGTLPHFDGSSLWISAMATEGMNLISDAIRSQLAQQFITAAITLLPKQANIRARLYDLDAVLQEEFNNEGHWKLQIRLPELEFRRLGLGNIPQNYN